MYAHTHTRMRKYVMVGADLPPPGTNRVNIHACEHMILGQLRMGACQAINAPLCVCV